jgi:hypothetical protein
VEGKEKFSPKGLLGSAAIGAASNAIPGGIGAAIGKYVARPALKAVAAGARKAAPAALNTAARVVKATASTVKSSLRRSCSFLPGNSFSPETPILMADGAYKPILEVQVGNQVLATDPTTGSTSAETVSALHVNLDKDLLDLVVYTEKGWATVHTTDNHSFCDETRRAWISAADLPVGDLLSAADGSTVSVVAKVLIPGQRLMYNLTVDELHTYYVVESGTAMLVHNVNGKQKPKAAPKKAPVKAPAKTAARKFLPTQKAGRNKPLNPAQEKDLAKYLGYNKKAPERAHGRAVYTNGKTFISQDVGDGIGSHNGGTWKIANSAKELGSKQTRTALLNHIGC